MLEMNINIEGYNIDGICVGCLNYNRKMFYCEEVKDCFKILGNIDMPDGLSIQVCWECLAAVQAVSRFRDQILNSYEILINYSRKHTFLNAPSDLSQHAVQRLSLSQLELEELDVTAVQEAEEESEAIKSESEFFDHADFSQGLEISSEEDIQLSVLKENEEVEIQEVPVTGTKPGIVLQSSCRKLQKLPPHLVELCTVTEEEMWQIRAEDAASEEFCSMKYRCQSCVVVFISVKLMAGHMMFKHVEKGHQCDVCKAYFYTRESLSKHRARHLVVFRCVPCGARTSLKRRALAHARGHRGGRRCSLCGDQFSASAQARAHERSCARAAPHCACCGRGFANKSTLRDHLRNRASPKIQPQRRPKPKVPQIKCKVCDKVFCTKKGYRAHAEIHSGVRYPCAECGKLFRWKGTLGRHLRNHRERDAGTSHSCQECGKMFSSRDSYYNHMRLSKRHAQGSADGHVCSYCGKQFASARSLADHVDWDHERRVKYQCAVCFKAFKTAVLRWTHVNTVHQGRRNREPGGLHLCAVCGKSYKTAKYLSNHVSAAHTRRPSAKSYKCPLCPASFTWSSGIHRHMQTKHDNKRPKVSPPRL